MIFDLMVIWICLLKKKEKKSPKETGGEGGYNMINSELLYTAPKNSFEDSVKN